MFSITTVLFKKKLHLFYGISGDIIRVNVHAMGPNPITEIFYDENQ